MDEQISRKEHITMEISYTRAGDYYLPNIFLRDPPDPPPLGRYGRLRRAFLREHRPILYNQLLLSEKLFPHLQEIDEAAQTRMTAIPDREIAHEIICAEIVYD